MHLFAQTHATARDARVIFGLQLPIEPVLCAVFLLGDVDVRTMRINCVFVQLLSTTLEC